jgi:signal transduction histidine kinase
MASVVDICNQALIRVGADTIISLGDGTQEAKLCNLWFNTVVEETIAEGMWSSAIFRIALNRTTNVPAFEYDFEYQLPTNPKVINVLEINENRAGDKKYAIEGDKLLSNESVVKIKYLGRVDNTELFGPYLTRAIVTRLASELAFPLTSNRALAESLLRKYEMDLQKGLTNDNQQGTSIELIANDLLDVRLNASGFNSLRTED